MVVIPVAAAARAFVATSRAIFCLAIRVVAVPVRGVFALASRAVRGTGWTHALVVLVLALVLVWSGARMVAWAWPGAAERAAFEYYRGLGPDANGLFSRYTYIDGGYAWGGRGSGCLRVAPYCL